MVEETGTKPLREKKREKAIFLQRRYSYEPHKFLSNPSLDGVINKQFAEETRREYIKSLLRYFENNPSIIWDKSGNLTQAFSGYNIIDIIKDIGTAKSFTHLDDFRLAIYKMLIDHTDLPIEAVKSKKIKESIYGGGGGGRRIANNKCSKVKLNKWLCYD